MDTRTFVSDSLLQFTGASDPTIVDFVIATANDAKSTGELRDKLLPFLEGGDEHGINNFCAELYGRGGPGGGSGKSKSHAITESSSSSKKQKYRLVEMEDEDMSSMGPPSVDSSEKRKRDKRKDESRSKHSMHNRWESDEDDHAHERSRRDKDLSSDGKGRKRERSRGEADSRDRNRRSRKVRRRDDEDFEDRWGDEEMLPEEEEYVDGQADGEPASPRSVASSSAGLDEEAKAERDRLRDIKERDEFAKRLAEKEDSKSKKKLVEDRTRRAGDSSRRALADNADARGAAMPDLRLRSRQEYLKKREMERIALLRRQVAEEAIELRENPDLSRREKEEFARNREVLRIAEERLRIDDHRDGYMMPEDYITEKGKIDRKKKEEALYKRYVDRDEQGHERFVTEQEEWEREQTAKAKAQISRAEFVDEGDYEYVFDDAQKINFIMDSKLEGDRKPLTKEQRMLQQQLDAAEKKAASIEETRKSLPVYQFRDEIIQAIHDHQVLIIVGETGVSINPNPNISLLFSLRLRG
jgi:pre-mRNA-splicing factor ATP-dependent RNA helicase DHX16